jgi:hypothetical protein
MVLKNVFIAVVCTTLLVWSGLATAEPYRGDQFLSLDLSKAVLSPEPLGPLSQFAPGPLGVRLASDGEPAQASAPPADEPKITEFKATEPNVIVHRTHVAHVRAQTPRGAGRTRLARRHSNPLDAQAFDTRIQVWPCRSGGICGWKR